MVKKLNHFLLFLLIILTPFLGYSLEIGIGKADITPPLGTPSAGYIDRKGIGMEGINDPLLAIALYINNGEKKIIMCSVDHLGFTKDMVQEIIEQVHIDPKLYNCDIYIGSSHTHSGGGAYLNYPIIGESTAGKYNPEIRNFYIQKTAQAILDASKNTIEGQIGIGYGYVEGLSFYRGLWPKNVNPQYRS